MRVSQKAHRDRDFDLAQGSHQTALAVYLHRFRSNDCKDHKQDLHAYIQPMYTNFCGEIR